MALDPHINPATGVWDDNYYANLNKGGNSGGGGSGLNIPAFNFDYNAAAAEARAKLEPYYQQKLADAKGDVELAKKYIEEDYANGLRTAAEDNQAATTADAITSKGESNDLLGTLNKRGVLFGSTPTGDTTTGAMPFSGQATQEMGTLTDKQMLRKQAIDRALSRQNEVAQTTRDRGITAQDTQYPRTEQQIMEEENNAVQTQYVPMAYERAKDAYDNTYGQSLNQAVNQSVNANPYLQSLGWS